jgi:hypothetical protein
MHGEHFAHEHELRQGPGRIPQPTHYLTPRAALEMLAIPALFGGLWGAMAHLGAVPWWVIVGFAVYGSLSVAAIGAGARSRKGPA